MLVATVAALYLIFNPTSSLRKGSPWYTQVDPSGWHHRDLKASNILLLHHDETNEPTQAWIVDLDGLSRVAAADVKRERQRLVRLGASLIGHVSVTQTDLVRFLRAYFASSSTARDWRTEFRQLSRSAIRYAERSELRKRHKLDGYTGD